MASMLCPFRDKYSSMIRLELWKPSIVSWPSGSKVMMNRDSSKLTESICNAYFEWFMPIIVNYSVCQLLTPCTMTRWRNFPLFWVGQGCWILFLDSFFEARKARFAVLHLCKVILSSDSSQGLLSALSEALFSGNQYKQSTTGSSWVDAESPAHMAVWRNKVYQPIHK